MRLVFIGLPGAGKGTQASTLAHRLGIPHISTGDIFRLNIAQSTPLGVIAKHHIDKGEYVPDEVTNDMVQSRLSQDDCAEGFILDGYPRTLDQVERLTAMLDLTGVALDAVVELKVDTEAVVARLLLRAADGTRSDDTEPIIRHRIDIYRDQTAPLLAVYREMDLLRTIDGEGPVDEVAERILAALYDSPQAGGFIVKSTWSNSSPMSHEYPTLREAYLAGRQLSCIYGNKTVHVLHDGEVYCSYHREANYWFNLTDEAKRNAGDPV